MAGWTPGIGFRGSIWAASEQPDGAER